MKPASAIQPCSWIDTLVSHPINTPGSRFPAVCPKSLDLRRLLKHPILRGCEDVVDWDGEERTPSDDVNDIDDGELEAYDSDEQCSLPRC